MVVISQKRKIGLGLGVRGLGFRIRGLGFRIRGLGSYLIGKTKRNQQVFNALVASSEVITVSPTTVVKIN